MVSPRPSSLILHIELLYSKVFYYRLRNSESR